MDLRMYERNKFNQYIVPIYKKDKCECCGATEDLDLHHEDRFIYSLRKTLEIFNLEEKDTDEYTKEELNIITNYMLGIQVKQKYKTLCGKCHAKEHSTLINYDEKYGIETTRITDKEKVKEKLEYMKNNYVPKILNKKLTTKDKNKICKEFGIIDDKGRLIKWTRIKKIINEFGYEIEDKTLRINKKRTKVSIIYDK